jgi:Tfp pilus assembly protein FimV
MKNRSIKPNTENIAWGEREIEDVQSRIGLPDLQQAAVQANARAREGHAHAPSAPHSSCHRNAHADMVRLKWATQKQITAIGRGKSEGKEKRLPAGLKGNWYFSPGGWIRFGLDVE